MDRKTGRRVVSFSGLALGLLLLAGPGRADGPDEIGPLALPVVSRSLTLRDAVAVALADNPGLRGTQADADAAAAEARAAAAPLQPGLSTTTYLAAGTADDIFFSSPGVLPQNAFNVPHGGFADQDLMLMVPLLTGGRLESHRDTARHQAGALTAATDAARRTLAASVAEAYHKTLLQQALVAVAQSRLTLENEQLRVTGEMVHGGHMAPVDLLREQAEQADAQQGLLAAQNQATLALVDLKAALGVSQVSQITLSETLDSLAAQPFAVPASLENALQLAAAHRPELQAAARRVDAARAALREARSGWSPQVYGIAMGDAMVRHGGQTHAGYSVGLTASLPLSDGGRRQADVAAAKARLARAAADGLAVRQTVERETAAAWLALQTATAQQTAAGAGVAAAKEAYALATLRYNSGKTIAAQRFDALAALTRAQGTLAAATAAVVDARSQLALATGAPPGP